MPAEALAGALRADESRRRHHPGPAHVRATQARSGVYRRQRRRHRDDGDAAHGNGRGRVGRNRVFAGRAQIGGRSIEEVRAEAMAAQSIKAMIEPERHRGARGVPRLRRRQVDQRPGAADR